MRVVSFATLACLACAALAQDERPAVDISPQSAPPAAEGPGTTILGERESPIGLYITPWRSAGPEAALERPARLLDEVLRPVDPDVHSRYVEYHGALEAHRARKTGGQ